MTYTDLFAALREESKTLLREQTLDAMRECVELTRALAQRHTALAEMELAELRGVDGYPIGVRR